MCNTCDELICDRCSREGPHNTSYHVLQTIEVAYKYRKKIIDQNFSKCLDIKKEVLERKMNNLQLVVDKLKEAGSFIAKDTKVYFERLANNLKNSFNTDVSEYIARVEYYEGEVRDINGMINYFNKYMDNSRHFEFLVIYSRIFSKMKELEDRKHGSLEIM